MFGFGKKKNEPEKQPELDKEPAQDTSAAPPIPDPFPKADEEHSQAADTVTAEAQEIEVPAPDGMNIPLKVKITPIPAEEQNQEAAPAAKPDEAAPALRPAIAALKGKLEAAGIKNIQVVNRPEFSSLFFLVAGKASNKFTLHFVAESAKNDLTVRTMEYCTVPAEKRAAILELINDLNGRFRFGTFILGKDNKVNLRMSVPQSVPDAGPVCVEYMMRIFQIADAAYPELMKAIWG